MTHPLDPLSASEISQAVDRFREHHESGAYFSSIGLIEPPKAQVKTGQPTDRVAPVSYTHLTLPTNREV